eukprot:4376308-Pleurochrysis_carterae.AAC.1
MPEWHCRRRNNIVTKSRWEAQQAFGSTYTVWQLESVASLQSTWVLMSNVACCLIEPGHLPLSNARYANSVT